MFEGLIGERIRLADFIGRERGILFPRRDPFRQPAGGTNGKWFAARHGDFGIGFAIEVESLFEQITGRLIYRGPLRFHRLAKILEWHAEVGPRKRSYAAATEQMQPARGIGCSGAYARIGFQIAPLLPLSPFTNILGMIHTAALSEKSVLVVRCLGHQECTGARE